jgi:hypothetical protein
LNILSTSEYFDESFQGITWLIYKEHFPLYKDTLRFIRSYDNFVYDVSSKGIKKRYKIVYKKDPLPEDVMSIVKPDLKKFKDLSMNPNIKNEVLKKYARFTGNWLENDKYIYFSSRDSQGEFGNSFFTLIEKRSKKVIFKTKSICETSRYKLLLPPLVCFDAARNEFIGIMTGSELKNAMYKGSSFWGDEIDDPESFYLIRVKIK